MQKSVVNAQSATPSILSKDSSLAPPYTWQEHWFDHRQLIKRVYFNNNIAVYFDDDVSREKTSWIFGLVDSAWGYTKKNTEALATLILPTVYSPFFIPINMVAGTRVPTWHRGTISGM
ncbi:hypothetical protein LWM68_28100 [Niabella sp. W65]|nr:hypothetical protein [Niabella sp. W65]MCH7366296.1 hypothetical protein [Niabella sp. W65]ULT42019.1 hypothetical protein KRR40_47055 [Niabella sp. I65]